jgi:pyridoxamine 5'-phosphate oxidase
MNKAEMLKFLNTNPASHLATVDGNRPRVRGILIYRADESGILFHTGATKDLYRQIMTNPAVEFCFNDYRTGVQIRVEGTAQVVADQALKEEIVAARSFLPAIVERDGWDALVIFRVTGCRAVIWTMETNMLPKDWVELTG